MMKMMKNSRLLKLLLPVFAMIAATALYSCSGSKDSGDNKPIRVYIDHSVYNLVKPLFGIIDSIQKENKYELIDTTALGAMAMLLTDTNFKVCIIPRDYTPEEKEQMALYKVEDKPRAVMAKDALVFFTGKDYPVDTLSAGEVQQLFTDDKFSLKALYPALTKDPLFAICNQYSSEYENLKNIVLKGKPGRKVLKPFSTADSVIDYVALNKEVIGVGYLSQVVNDPRVKMLKIGFADSTGKWIRPRIVHQANIVQGFYPYVVNHYIYLYNKTNGKADWLLRFLSQSSPSQNYFNEAGIVPAYGKFKLIME